LCDNVACANPCALRVRALLDRNDYRCSADFAHRDTYAYETRVLPVKPFIWRKDARVCVLQIAQHASYHAVQLSRSLCTGRERAKPLALHLPVKTVKRWIVVTLTHGLPDIIEDGEPTITCCASHSR